MTRRSVSRGMTLGLVLMLGAGIVACYDPPKPDCGFRCGPAAACPADYTCGNDDRCHLNGSSPTLQCGTADASVAPPDAYSPVAFGFSPPDGAIDVDIHTAISARFDVDVFNVFTGSFGLSIGFDRIIGTVFYDAMTRTATFFPNEPLPPNTTIQAELNAAISDANDNRLRRTTWSFTTGNDTTSPAVTSATPGPNATLVSVAANIVVTFSEPVQNVDILSFAVRDAGGLIEGTITMTNGNRTATYDPTGSMPAGAVITVNLSSAITDASNNPLAATSYSFTTAP